MFWWNHLKRVCFCGFKIFETSFHDVFLQAPAAFGLVSFLLHDGLDRGRIRKHLFAFSAAAPIGAILTFLILNHVSCQVQDQAIKNHTLDLC